MRPCAAALVVVAMSTFGKATTEAPYAGQCKVLEQVVARSPQPDLALALLMRIAVGRTAGVPAEMEKLLKVPEGRLQERDFAAPEVRACAFYRIGDLGSAEAAQFLSKLSRSDLGADAPIELWTASRIGLQRALLHRIAVDQDKRLFLENILASPHNGMAGVWMWAIDQLCNRGDALSIGLIQGSIRELWSSQYGEDEIAFCRERIQVVSRYPERAKAIGSVLKADAERVDGRLLRWAIQQLAAMRSPAADAELRRFAVEARRVTGGSRTHPLARGLEAAESAIGARSVNGQ